MQNRFPSQIIRTSKQGGQILSHIDIIMIFAQQKIDNFPNTQ